MQDRPEGSNDYEIRLLRTRFHKLSGELAKVVLGLAEVKRDLADTDEDLRECIRKLGEVTKTVEQMATADAIAAEVAKRVRSHNRLYLSVGQKIGGAVIGAIAVADFVLSITGHR